MYRFIVVTSVLVVLGLIAILAVSSIEPETDVSIINGAPVHNLDPAKMSWMHDIRTAYGLWEGLLTTDPETLAAIPGVADSYEVTDDGRIYTFHLREDARWSNGDPVTAGDFRWSWFRVLDPANASDYYTLMFVIEGAEDYYRKMGEYRNWQQASREAGDDPHKRRDLGPLPPLPNPHTVGIHCIAADKLQVVLARPVPYFPELVAFATFLPVHKATVSRFYIDRPRKAPPTWDPAWLQPENLVCNGPFVLERWDFSRRLLLKRNKFYWDRDNVPSRRIELRADSDVNTAFLSYESGAADVITSLPVMVAPALIQRVQTGQRPDLHVFPVWGTYYYRFNCGKEPLTDPRVRQALALCVNRREIVEKITRRGERPQTSFVTPGLSVLLDAAGAPAQASGPGWRLGGEVNDKRQLFYEPSDGLEFDPQRGRQLLAAAGYGPGGKPFPGMTLLINNSMHQPIAEAVISMWKTNLGITVRLESLVSSIAGSRMKNHDFDVCRSGWFTDYGDPTGFLAMFRKGDGNNDGQFDVPQYDALLAQADEEADPVRRYELIQQAERILVQEQAGVIPIYQYVGQYMFRDDIGGIWLNDKQQIMLKHVYRKK